MTASAYPTLVPSLPHLLYGGDYNPEQWPEQVWLEDVALMREAGVNFLSVGIFSWGLLEPNEGEYDFGWLRSILDLLTENGIGVCLATATASPPAWFTRTYPKSRPVTASGAVLDFGARQQYCPNSPEYREHSDRLVGKIVKEFGQHPAVKMWHLNNELGCHIQECHCPNCDVAFRLWLRAKYDDLSALNDAWGTAFWSQHYGDWEQICTPKVMPTFPNPGQALDYRRFFSSSLGGVMLAELSVIRKSGNNLPATTNGMELSFPSDYFKWYESLDVAAWDSYPDPSEGYLAARGAAFGHDLNRSFKNGRPFMLMEQVTSQVNWRGINQLKPPGMMRAHNLQAVARGADACMFFQWRASRIGAEKFHGALLPHYGKVGRVYREVKALGKELSELDGVIGQPCPAEITILTSWDNLWAVELPSKPAKLGYRETVLALHGACWDLNLMTSIAPPSRSFSPSTKIVIAPLCYLLSDQEAARLRDFVSAGGTLLMTYFSGVADEKEHIGLGGYPSKLRDVLGVTVEEWQPYPKGAGNTIRWEDGRDSSVSLFAEILVADSARTLASYAEDFFAGSPAVTVNIFGQGKAYYVSTHLEADDWRRLVLNISKESGVKAAGQNPAGVEIVRRGDKTFVINHNGHASWAEVRGVEGKQFNRMELEPYAVRIF